MIRRRREEDLLLDPENDDTTTTTYHQASRISLTTFTIENDGKKRRYNPFLYCGFCCSNFSFPKYCNKRKTLFAVVLLTGIIIIVACTIYALVRQYYRFELTITDPLLQAKLYMPFRYLHVRYFDRRPPSRRQRTFTMMKSTSTTTFVINMDRDRQRMQLFRQHHANLTFTRFAAPEWIADTGTTTSSTTTRDAHHHNRLRSSTQTNTTTAATTIDTSSHDAEYDDTDALKLQKTWEKQYPFLRQSSARGRYGDAGCSFAHMLLLQQKLLNSNNNTTTDAYIFVLEDDAVVQKPLLTKKTVEAPADADVVLLVPTITKKVLVPYPTSAAAAAAPADKHADNVNDDFAVRVLQAYGAYGYIITQEGARKLLQYLQRHAVPIDVALAAAPSLRVYQPNNDWPQVRHRAGVSLRHNLNG